MHIYIREGCKYCHTQQMRTLARDVKRSGWKGVESPVSTPDEFVYDDRHTFGTKRTGPDLSRVGGKYNKQWHRSHFRNPRDLVPGSIMPPFPWIVNNPRKNSMLLSPICRRAAATRTGVPITTTRSEANHGMTQPRQHFFSNFLFFLLVGGAAFFFVRSLKDGYLGIEQRRAEVPHAAGRRFAEPSAR